MKQQIFNVDFKRQSGRPSVCIYSVKLQTDALVVGIPVTMDD